MTAHQTVTFTVEVVATLSAKPTLNDYGVPGSPVWTEYDAPAVDELEIEGVTVDPVKLRDLLGKDALALIEEQAVEAADPNGWADE